MATNNEDFRDKLTLLAEVAEQIESNTEFFGDEIIEVRVKLEKEKYDSVLRNFREIDWSSDKFYINFGKVSYKFVLKR